MSDILNLSAEELELKAQYDSLVSAIRQTETIGNDIKTNYSHNKYVKLLTDELAVVINRALQEQIRDCNRVKALFEEALVIRLTQKASR